MPRLVNHSFTDRLLVNGYNQQENSNGGSYLKGCTPGESEWMKSQTDCRWKSSFVFVSPTESILDEGQSWQMQNWVQLWFQLMIHTILLLSTLVYNAINRGSQHLLTFEKLKQLLWTSYSSVTQGCYVSQCGQNITKLLLAGKPY